MTDYTTPAPAPDTGWGGATGPAKPGPSKVRTADFNAAESEFLRRAIEKNPGLGELLFPTPAPPPKHRHDPPAVVLPVAAGEVAIITPEQARKLNADLIGDRATRVAFVEDAAGYLRARVHPTEASYWYSTEDSILRGGTVPSDHRVRLWIAGLAEDADLIVVDAVLSRLTGQYLDIDTTAAADRIVAGLSAAARDTGTPIAVVAYDARAGVSYVNDSPTTSAHNYVTAERPNSSVNAPVEPEPTPAEDPEPEPPPAEDKAAEVGYV